jgi:hypothetical protein
MSNQNPVNRVPPDGITVPVTASISRTSDLTGLSRSEIYRQLAAGKLHAVKSGRSTLVVIQSALDHLASLPAATFRAPVMEAGNE